LIQPVLLSNLVDEILTEKRIQYRSQIGIETEFDLDPYSYGIFVKVNKTEMKRVLSNLIDNSVESFQERGKIKLCLSQYDGRVLLTVNDTGKGIPPEQILKLGTRGATFNKAKGSGLGLHHAITQVKQWGGILKIESQVGLGTTVSITLPRTATPEWF